MSMMATSMGPNFTGHPAMGHPGVGHPMGGPGMPPNAAQQGAPGGGMPHQFAAGHLAVSGPGGQVNPGMMGAMPPGPNHGAHGLQHMNPAQQQMFQQQHLQNQFNNPSAMAAMRQQQMLQQHQQQQRQMMAQQAYQAANMQGVHGMPMGMPNQLTAQQLNQLRQAGRLPVAHNPMLAQQLAFHQQQQQQQQQHAAQAAQAQAQAQAAQAQAQAQAQQAQQAQVQAQQVAHGQQMPGAHNPAQHMQMGAQGMPNMQQQNPMAGAGQAPMGGQQPGQQPQGQPQSQQQVGVGPQSQQGPQQSSQSGTPGNTGQQTPSQTTAPAPIPAGQMGQGQGQVQPQQGQPQGQPQMSAAATQHQMAMNAILQQQQHNQRREQIRSACLVKLLQLGERLTSFPGSVRKDDLSYWNQFVNRFFASPNGVFRHSLHFDDPQDATDKQYEISFPAIARYFHTNFSSGVKSMQLLLDSNTSDRLLPGECYCLENPKASFVYWFDNGTHLVANGVLRAQFDSEQKIEVFEFQTTEHVEFIPRKQVIEAAKPAHLWMKEWHKANSIDSKQSPEMSKKGKARQLKSPQKEPPEVLGDLPPAVNKSGVTVAVHQFLEIAEVMGQMNPLFGFYHGNPGLSPYAALEQYVSTIQGSTPVMNGQGGMQGPRTPSLGQFSMGTSPAAAHVNLPGSPHIGSPAAGQMQAPGMQLQPSQQGTSSSGPSANTSPASNKRRRPSTVKVEEDTTGSSTPAVGGQVNGGIQRGNKPPTPRMPKRLKGNPS